MKSSSDLTQSFMFPADVSNPFKEKGKYLESDGIVGIAGSAVSMIDSFICKDKFNSLIVLVVFIKEILPCRFMCHSADD